MISSMAKEALFLAALIASIALGPLLQAQERPNILVIISDDQGWADIGYNNPQGCYTPNMDRLASGGITFSRHYVMPQCTPTRVAAFTGRYPSRFGTGATQASNEPAFPRGTPTMASMLRDAGYETHLSGKWHMGSSAQHGPNHFGFESSYGSLAGAVGMYDHRYRKGEFEITWHRNHEIIQGYENGEHVTELVSDDAISFIKKKRSKPFFLYLAYHAPHTPLDERGSFIDKPTQLDPDNPKRWLGEDKIKWFNDPEGIIQKQADPEKRLLLAVMHHLDHGIGRVVKALEESGQLENTLILYSSDNGPQVNWPGYAYPDDLKLTDFNQPIAMRAHKTHTYEGGIHVPGFAHWPAKLKARKENTVVHIIDWLPTIATLSGAEAPENLDGLDLSELLLHGKPLAERHLYWAWAAPIRRWALRHGDWKIVRYGKSRATSAEDWELYNLQDDPKEKNDLAKQHPDILGQMHRRFLDERKKDAQK